jgi:hypothetical protein
MKNYMITTDKQNNTPKNDVVLKTDIFDGQGIRKVFYQKKWYFSVVDVVRVLTESGNPKEYIKKMRSRDDMLSANWGTICTPLEVISKDGKKRAENMAEIKGILRIIQSIPSPKAEPFKLWLAKVGQERIEEIENPELATTEFSVTRDSQGFTSLKKDAGDGGEIAGQARKSIEKKSGKKITNSNNYLLK